MMLIADTMTLDSERSSPDSSGNRHTYDRIRQLRAALEALVRVYPISLEASLLLRQCCASMRPRNTIPLPSRFRHPHSLTGEPPPKKNDEVAAALHRVAWL